MDTAAHFMFTWAARFIRVNISQLLVTQETAMDLTVTSKYIEAAEP